MKKQLLIVEDDPLMAEAAADYFTGKGWSAETAGDGTEALEMLQTLEETVGEEAGADDAFRERFARYLLGTLCAHGSRYQQFSGAVYDAEEDRRSRKQLQHRVRLSVR